MYKANDNGYLLSNICAVIINLLQCNVELKAYCSERLVKTVLLLCKRLENIVCLSTNVSRASINGSENSSEKSFTKVDNKRW